MIQLTLPPKKSDVLGLPVKRLLPQAKRRSVGPFIFMDHMGPADIAVDIGPHPHIGLATVTWLFEGCLRHRDSLGFVQDIQPGDVNWMTAGSGIVHSERTPEESRDKDISLHGIQTWVALPQAHEETAPAFHHHSARTLPVLDQDGIRIVVVAGSAFGETSPVKVFSPTLYCDIHLSGGASVQVGTEHVDRAVYPIKGKSFVDGVKMKTNHLTILSSGVEVTIEAGPSGAHFMLVGGAPLDGERFIHWNYVASTRERIQAAVERWDRDEFPRVPGETGRIPHPPR